MRKRTPEDWDDLICAACWGALGLAVILALAGVPILPPH